MIKHFFQSTVFKIAALMFSVSFLAIFSMFSSFFISDGAQTDALSINVAGSLRMNSYRLVSLVQMSDLNPGEQKAVLELLDKLEQDLTTGVLLNKRALMGYESSMPLYEEIKQDWFVHIKPTILLSLNKQNIDHRTLVQMVDAFVAKVNNLVMSYQNHAEDNIATIRLILSLALFGTLILIAIAMAIVNWHIEMPLSRLIMVAKQIGRGDFTVKADENGTGELALLARTINKMSGSIYRSQAQLEEQVKRKTHKLSRSNQALDLLFSISRKLNEVEPTAMDFQPILNQLARVTGVDDLDLCIMTPQGSGPYEHLVSKDKPMPEMCLKGQCGDCTQNQIASPDNLQPMRYPLSMGGNNYGVLVVHPNQSVLLEDWQHQLFESVAEQVANGMSMKYQQEQNRRIELMNERTVIARELHDSLAQALSYLKIQVTRLQRLHKKQDAEVQINQVVDELKSGLSAAYSELRELLTTFRLKLDGQGIQAALEQTIEQLKARSDAFTFILDNRAQSIPFTPQEEIHLVQIAREATQNAFHHSKGKNIKVQLLSEPLTDIVVLTVSDDGIGIPDNPGKLNHYGLAIMQERCRNLQGQLSISRNQDKGTTVTFSFTPDYVKQMALKKHLP